MPASRVALAALLALVAIGAAGCSGSDSSGASTSIPAAEGAVAPAAGGSAAITPGGAADAGLRAGPALGSPTLVRTAETTLTVAERPRARGEVVAVAARLGGGLVGESSTPDSTTLEVTVAAARFDQALAELAGLGTERDRRVDSQDVGAEVADVGARVASQQASLTRLRSLYDRAGTVTEVQAVEAAITERESSLESLQARVRTLAAQTQQSRITVRLVGPDPVLAAAPQRTTPARALAAGWRAFGSAVLLLVVALAAALPFLLAGAVVGAATLITVRRLRAARVASVPH